MVSPKAFPAAITVVVALRPAVIMYGFSPFEATIFGGV